MSYEKNTWSNGDIITAEKLNNIENGVAEAQPQFEIIKVKTWGDYKPSHSYEELLRIANDGIPFIISNGYITYACSNISLDDDVVDINGYNFTLNGASMGVNYYWWQVHSDDTVTYTTRSATFTGTTQAN